MPNSREYNAIAKVTADLNIALSSFVSLEYFADKLVDAAIISRHVRQSLDTLGLSPYVKAGKLTDAMVSKVRLMPENFHTIIGIMSEEEALKEIVERLMQLYRGDERTTRQQYPAAIQARPEVTTLKDYLHGIPGEGLEDALDREVTEYDLAMIARSIDDWQYLLPFLGMTPVDRRTILDNNPHNVERQRVDMLHMWHSRNGRRKAIYRNLTSAFLAAGKTSLTDVVIETIGYKVPVIQVGLECDVPPPAPKSGSTGGDTSGSSSHLHSSSQSLQPTSSVGTATTPGRGGGTAIHGVQEQPSHQGDSVATVSGGSTNKLQKLSQTLPQEVPCEGTNGTGGTPNGVVKDELPQAPPSSSTSSSHRPNGATNTESQAHRHLATRLTDDRTNPIPSDTDRQPECPDGPATAGQVDHGEVSPAVSLVYRLWQLLRGYSPIAISAVMLAGALVYVWRRRGINTITR